ncbi:MAG: hypothetical protein KBE19_10860, partial [Rhodocyclaceae bacterium]|nr:hypothetical protein [Rhodocyclaceae bacterium]
GERLGILFWGSFGLKIRLRRRIYGQAMSNNKRSLTFNVMFNLHFNFQKIFCALHNKSLDLF